MSVKYTQIIDTEWLYLQLTKKSMMDLAEELSKEIGGDKQSIAGSIRYQVQSKFTKEMKAKIKKDRRFHKNRKKKRLIFDLEGNIKQQTETETNI